MAVNRKAFYASLQGLVEAAGLDYARAAHLTVDCADGGSVEVTVTGLGADQHAVISPKGD